MPARQSIAAALSLALAVSPVCATTVKTGPVINVLPSGKLAPVLTLPALPTTVVSPSGVDTTAPATAFSVRAFDAQKALTPQAATPVNQALQAVVAAAVPVTGQAVEPAALNRAWDAQKPGAAQDVVVPSIPSSSLATPQSGLAPSTSKGVAKSREFKLAAGAAAGPLAAKGFLGSAFAWAAPYVYSAGVLGATWVAQRVVRATINGMAKRGKWNPNTTDSVLFVATLATWLAGAAVGMKLAGIELAAIFTTFGIAITLAVRSTVSNLVQAVIILIQRPFVIGETVRIGETLYRVEDMQLSHATMKPLGTLAKEAPAADKVEKGVVVKPFAEVDPLGREVDEKGNRFVLVRVAIVNPQNQVEEREPETLFPYTALGASAVTLFRGYTRDHKKLEREKLKAALAGARNPITKFYNAVKETGRGTLLRAGIWMTLAVAGVVLLPLLPITWSVFVAGLPYLHALSILIAARYAATFFGRLAPKLFEKFGRSPQAAVVARLLVEIAIWAIGLSAAMRMLGVEWSGVVQSLGVTAAAMTVATNDVLKNLAQAVVLRLFNRPFEIGDFIRTKAGEFGEVEEMGMFYVVIKPTDGVHTVVPYGALDGAEITVFRKKSPSQPESKP